jgi:transposase InsO family protein
MLLRLHQGHWGINKTKSLASDTIWWFGINKDIKNMIAKCEKCQVRQASQVHEPLIASDVPPGPWIRVGADLCQDGRNHYLVMVDYYSKFIEIFKISSQTSKEVTLLMKSAFARFGMPFEMVTDNGPCFASMEFKNFAKECGFKHITTSPHFPQANGQAESAVKIAKKIIQQDDPFTALLQYRATPTAATGYSPAQLLMGRRIATTLPTKLTNLVPNVPDPQLVKDRLKTHKTKYAQVHDRKHNARPLSTLKPGDDVRWKIDTQRQWGPRSQIVSQAGTRSYIVRNPDGSTVRRNRRHLQRVPPGPPIAPRAVPLVPPRVAPNVAPPVAMPMPPRAPYAGNNVPPGNNDPPARRHSERAKSTPRRLIEEI